MQKNGIIIAASILVMLAASFFFIPQMQITKADDKLVITVTTNIIADAVYNIAGDAVVLNCLMQPGIDPHSYHARLSDLRSLLEADLIFYNGLHLEGKMATVLHKIHGIKPTFAVSDALQPDQLISSEEFDGIYDPHIWFDVMLWKQVVCFIADVLCSNDPRNQALYRKNLDTYLVELDALEAYIRTAIAAVKPSARFLITTHDAFSYFGRAYDFTVIGLQGINLDAEPCIKNMHELVTLICRHNIPVIFVESSLPHRSMQAIAQAVSAHGQHITIGDELYSDTVGPLGSGDDSYVGMVTHNIDALVRGLNPLYTVT